MSLRGSQEDKFRHITIKPEPIRTNSPDMHTSNAVKPTSSPSHSPTNRPSTPINAYKFISREAAPQLGISQQSYMTSSHIMSRPLAETHNAEMTQSQPRSRIVSQNLRNSYPYQEQELVTRLQGQIEEKEQIINELKTIIRISHENNHKNKSKSIILSESSPDRLNETQEKELKQLRHNVKILTIENNSLSDYIDRLKKTKAAHQDQQNKQEQQAILEKHFQMQINRLKDVIDQQEGDYEKKIDEFITSHKSLARECKILEQDKSRLEAQNQRLGQMLRDSQESYRKLNNSLQQKITKNSSMEKFSIQKIKEQYAESIRQLKETVSYQTNHYLDQFQGQFELVAKKIAPFEQKLAKLEYWLTRIKQKEAQTSRVSKKSQIYIEEGVQSSNNSSSRRRIQQGGNSLDRPSVVFSSRVYESPGSEDRTKPLREEVYRLRQIVNELESQISHKADQYTFRQREYQNIAAELSSYRTKFNIKEDELIKNKKQKELRERQLLEQIQRHKAQINKLEFVYKRERNNIHQTFHNQMQLKDQKIADLRAQLDSLHFKYQQSVSEIQRYASSARFEADLSRENNRLKTELSQCINKIQQYKKLFIILKEENEENKINEEIFEELKGQIYLVREKYHNDLLRLSQLEKDKEELTIVNRDFKGKLEEYLEKYNFSYENEKKLTEAITRLELQRQSIKQRVVYLQKTVNILESELSNKKQIENTLLNERNNLEKQIIGYLSLFRKMNSEEGKDIAKSRCIIHEQFGLEELLNKVSKLQASIESEKSSRKEKRARVAEILSESILQVELSESRRR